MSRSATRETKRRMSGPLPRLGEQSGKGKLQVIVGSRGKQKRRGIPALFAAQPQHLLHAAPSGCQCQYEQIGSAEMRPVCLAPDDGAVGGELSEVRRLAGVRARYRHRPPIRFEREETIRLLVPARIGLALGIRYPALYPCPYPPSAPRKKGTGSEPIPS